MAIHRFQTHPAYRHLLQALRREQQVQLVALTFLILLSATVGSQFIRVNGLIAGVAFFGLFVGMGLLLRLLAKKPWEDRHELLELLEHHPERVVWVYGTVTQRMPFGFRFTSGGLLYFKLLDGSDYVVSMAPQQLKLVSRFLNRVLPHATFGHSPAHEAAYRDDPNSLRRTRPVGRRDG